jgi:gas vesicle protein
MQNKFTPEISKSLQHENKHEVKIKIDNLSGQNWVKEIRELSSEFSLDANKIITNVKHFLADAIDGETLKKEFEENKDHYQKYYEKLENETFNEAKEITEALIAYVSKVKKNTQEKLTHLLISNPGIEKRMPVFMKTVLGEEAPVAEEKPVVEATKESIDQDQVFIDEITEILHKNISEEEMA